MSRYLLSFYIEAGFEYFRFCLSESDKDDIQYFSPFPYMLGSKILHGDGGFHVTVF